MAYWTHMIMTKVKYYKTTKCALWPSWNRFCRCAIKPPMFTYFEASTLTHQFNVYKMNVKKSWKKSKKVEKFKLLASRIYRKRIKPRPCNWHTHTERERERENILSNFVETRSKQMYTTMIIIHFHKNKIYHINP